MSYNERQCPSRHSVTLSLAWGHENVDVAWRATRLAWHLHGTRRADWYGMVWYGYGYGMVWYGMVRFGLGWFGLVWFGLVWTGLGWFGLVRAGLVWFGAKIFSTLEPKHSQSRKSLLCSRPTGLERRIQGLTVTSARRPSPLPQHPPAATCGHRQWIGLSTRLAQAAVSLHFVVHGRT